MPKYTITEYAERVDVSRAYLYKLEKNNKIDFTVKGKKKYIDSDQADLIVKFKPAGRVTTKTAQINGGKRKGKDSNISELSTLTKIDIDLKTAKLEAQKTKNEKDLKQLVNFNETAETVFNFLRPLRDDLLEIAKRVSSMAYMAGSKLEAEKIINQEIERIMLSKVGNDYKFNEDLKKKIIQVLKM